MCELRNTWKSTTPCPETEEDWATKFYLDHLMTTFSEIKISRKSHLSNVLRYRHYRILLKLYRGRHDIPYRTERIKETAAQILCHKCECIWWETGYLQRNLYHSISYRNELYLRLFSVAHRWMYTPVTQRQFACVTWRSDGWSAAPKSANNDILLLNFALDFNHVPLAAPSASR